MSFNLNYVTQGLDLSGFGQGIAHGIQQGYLIRKQLDAKLESDIDNFQKNYNPNNLRDQDLPAFANAFQAYRESALRYSKLNRGGGKTEQIAAAKLLKDKALNEMNDLYKRSTIASSKESEYADWIKNARLKNYLIPDEVANNYSTLRNSSINDIDAKKIKSAWEYDFNPKEVDIKDLTDAMDRIGGHIKESVPVLSQGEKYGKTVNGKQLYFDNISIYTSRDANAVIRAINNKAPLNPVLFNAVKNSYDILSDGIKQGNKNSIDRLNSIKEIFKLPANAGIEKVTPAMVYGYDFYKPVLTKTIQDDSRAKQEVQTENEQFNRMYKAASLNKKEGTSFEHPSATINKIASSFESYKAPTAKSVSFTPKTNDRDVTREFTSYTLPNAIGGRTGFKNVLYNPGNTETQVEPFITYTTSDEPTTPKYSSLEQFNQLLVKSAPDVTFKGGKPIKAPKVSYKNTKPAPTIDPKNPAGLNF